jgi:hypothetical protein
MSLYSFWQDLIFGQNPQQDFLLLFEGVQENEM